MRRDLRGKLPRAVLLAALGCAGAGAGGHALASARLTQYAATAGERGTTVAMPLGIAMAAARRAGLASVDQAGGVVHLHQRRVAVTIINFSFRPAQLTVSAGTRITWTNHDSDPHTVVNLARTLHSEALDTDGTFSHVFTKPGTYAYYCGIHPYMHGTLVVRK